MPTSDLRAITDFESFRDFLEDERDWSLSGYSFDDLTFTYVAKELGLKPEGSREGKNLFVWHESFEGPDRLSHYSLKRWHSKKIVEPDDTGESWRHSAVVLQPLKKSFETILLNPDDAGTVRVAAELSRVLSLKTQKPNNSGL